MRYIYLIGCLLMLCQCAPASEPKPANLIPGDKMTSIMADIHIAEARVETAGLSGDSADAVFRKIQKDILKKYGTKEADFNTSYQYYLRNLSEFDKIYERVVDTLSRKETLLNAQNSSK